MLKGLRTSVYIVDNINSAKDWYSNVLGKQPYFDEPFYVGFNVGGFELGLLPRGEEGNPGPGGVLTYWAVDDAKAAYQRLIDMGAEAHYPVTDVGGNVLLGTVIDPFGNELGIIENPNFKIEE